MIRFKANGQRLSMMKIDLVADTIDYLTAEFEFIGWENFPIRVAHFRNGDAVYDIILTDDRILESDHLNLSAGIWNVYLHGNNGSSRITTNQVYFRVQETGSLSGEPMPEIPLSTAEQILQTAKNAEDTANAVAADAAAGKFNGKDGDPFTYADFTPEQIADLQRPALDAATIANTAAEEANTATNTANSAASNANTAAEEAQRVSDSIVADVNQIKSDVAAITPDDTAVNGKPWTSKHIVDTLCQPIEEAGNPVQCYPVEHYPMGVTVRMEPIQEGSGDPSPENVRPIVGRDKVKVTRCGKNLLKMPFDYIPVDINGIHVTINDDKTITVTGTAENTVAYIIRALLKGKEQKFLLGHTH